MGQAGCQVHPYMHRALYMHGPSRLSSSPLHAQSSVHAWGKQVVKSTLTCTELCTCMGQAGCQVHPYMHRALYMHGASRLSSPPLHAQSFVHAWGMQVVKSTLTCTELCTCMSQAGCQVHPYMHRALFMHGPSRLSSSPLHAQSSVHAWAKQVVKFTLTCTELCTCMGQAGCQVHSYMHRALYMHEPSRLSSSPLHAQSSEHAWAKQVVKFTLTCTELCTCMGQAGCQVHPYMHRALYMHGPSRLSSSPYMHRALYMHEPSRLSSSSLHAQSSVHAWAKQVVKFILTFTELCTCMSQAGCQVHPYMHGPSRLSSPPLHAQNSVHAWGKQIVKFILTFTELCTCMGQAGCQVHPYMHRALYMHGPSRLSSPPLHEQSSVHAWAKQVVKSTLTCTELSTCMGQAGCQVHPYMHRALYMHEPSRLSSPHLHAQSSVHAWAKQVVKSTLTCTELCTCIGQAGCQVHLTCTELCTCMSQAGCQVHPYMHRALYMHGQAGCQVHPYMHRALYMHGPSRLSSSPLHAQSSVHAWAKQVVKFTLTCTESCTCMSQAGCQVHPYIHRALYMHGQAGCQVHPYSHRALYMHGPSRLSSSPLHAWAKQVVKFTLACMDQAGCQVHPYMHRALYMHGPSRLSSPPLHAQSSVHAWASRLSSSPLHAQNSVHAWASRLSSSPLHAQNSVHAWASRLSSPPLHAQSSVHAWAKQVVKFTLTCRELCTCMSQAGCQVHPYMHRALNMHGPSRLSSSLLHAESSVHA